MKTEQYITEVILAAFFAGIPTATSSQRSKWHTADPTKMYSWDRKHGFRFDREPEGRKS